MKKLLIIIPLVALIFSACENTEKSQLPTEMDVSFSISEMMDGGLKTEPDNVPNDWECQVDEEGNLLEPAYALVEIVPVVPVGDPPATPVTYQLEVFRLMGQLYTKTIKLDANDDGTAKQYLVNKFLLYDANDVLIMATPEVGSIFANYVSKPVAFEFGVNAFEKIEVEIEVLCFLPAHYNYFGFTWFVIDQIVVRELCFFADICLNGDPWFPESFAVPPYGPPIPGIDVPGAMKIWAFKSLDQLPAANYDLPDPAGNDMFTPVPNSPFTNWTTEPDNGLTQGPLCIRYPDNLLEEEHFWFWIQFYLPDATGGFSWQTYAISMLNGGLLMLDHSGTGAPLVDKDEDGIFDFVVGTCGDGSADWTFDWLYRGLN